MPSNENSTAKVMTFVLIMTSVVALLLAFLQNGLKSKHDFNEALYSKKATIAAVGMHLGEDLATLSGDQIQSIFDDQVQQFAVDHQGNIIDKDELLKRGVKLGLVENMDLKKEMRKPLEERLMPVYIYKKDDGKKFYILYARGKGLWDEIWGNVALESDLNTVAGVSFDHKAETPGLGAEIKDNKSWVRQFIGKKVFKDEKLMSINVRKGGAKDPYYEVDGISGATITGDGVSDMLYISFRAYSPYINSIKS